MTLRVRRILTLAILALWLASLAFPVFQIGPERGGTGIGFLLFGWMGLLIGEWTWIGNPFLLLAGALLWARRDFPRTFLLCAIVLGVVVLAETFRSSIVDNEGGIERDITAKLAGFYLWTGAVGVAAVVSLFQWALILRAGRPVYPPPYPDGEGGFARWEIER